MIGAPIGTGYALGSDAAAAGYAPVAQPIAGTTGVWLLIAPEADEGLSVLTEPDEYHPGAEAVGPGEMAAMPGGWNEAREFALERFAVANPVMPGFTK